MRYGTATTTSRHARDIRRHGVIAVMVVGAAALVAAALTPGIRPVDAIAIAMVGTTVIVHAAWVRGRAYCSGRDAVLGALAIAQALAAPALARGERAEITAVARARILRFMRVARERERDVVACIAARLHGLLAPAIYGARIAHAAGDTAAQ